MGTLSGGLFELAPWLGKEVILVPSPAGNEVRFGSHPHLAPWLGNEVRFGSHPQPALCLGNEASGIANSVFKRRLW
jgi:hypothetical protein